MNGIDEFPMDAGAAPAYGLRIEAVPMTAGPLAVFGIVVQNGNDESVTIDLSLNLREICLDYGSSYAMGHLDGSGVDFVWNQQIIGTPQGQVFRVHCRHHPLAVDADSYSWSDDRSAPDFWNQGSELQTGILHGQIAMSWQNRSIPAKGSATFSVIFGCANSAFEPLSPTLHLSNTEFPPVISAGGFGALSGNCLLQPDTTASLFLLFDDNVSRLVQKASGLGGTSFVIQVSPSEIGLEAGPHNLTVFAIDTNGMVSEPHRFSFLYLAGASASPLRSISRAKSMTIARSISASRSPTRTWSRRRSRTALASTIPAATVSPRRSPTTTPFPRLIMKMDSEDYSFNFRLFGSPSLTSDTVVNLCDGFQTVFRTRELTGRLYVLAPTKVKTSNLQLRTFVTLIGPCAIVAAQISNLGVTAEMIDVSIAGNININGNEFVPCFRTVNGFSGIDAMYSVDFLARDHPIVADADSVWFGDSADLPNSYWINATHQSFSGSKAALSISWRNRTIGPKTSLALPTVLRWGTGSKPPTLTFNPLLNPLVRSSALEVEGRVEDLDGDSVSILAVFDDDYSQPKVLQSALPSPAAFVLAMRLPDFLTELGLHNLSFVAVDATGTFSNVVSLTIDWQPDAAHSPTVSSSPLFTPSSVDFRRRRLLMEGVFFAYFWNQ
jgi:hypothetical protein